MNNPSGLPPLAPPSTGRRQQKFHEATAISSPRGGATNQNPSWNEPRMSNPPRASEKAKSASNGRSVAHDKVWLCTFLLHTLAYLGVSGYINYTAVTNDKQPITKDSDLGPINTYV
jgi:hypothetical protein